VAWPVAAIRLLLFTGCRLNEILTLRWEHVETDCLHLADSKSGPRTIHLNASARDVLAKLPRISGNQFVIVGQAGKHLADLERPWRRLRRAALLDDVRLHDLRHSFASIAVVGGLPLELIGGLLGHRHATMTEHYAHLGSDPLKTAVEAVGKLIEEAMRRKNP
jgi:integrase